MHPGLSIRDLRAFQLYRILRTRLHTPEVDVVTPILKNKQRRDTVLFWGMLILTLAFLLYVFFPASGPEAGSSSLRPGQTVAGDAQEPHNEQSYAGRLSWLLDNAFQARVKGSIAVDVDPTAALALHLDQVDQLGRTNAGREALKNWRRHSRGIGMFELGDPRILDVPAFVPPRVAFNLYLALFMLKLKNPDDLARLRDASHERLLNILSSPVFQSVEWEIHSDAAAFPALKVFRIWLERTGLYPEAHPGHELARQLDRFRDLSPGRWINRMRRWADFSSQVIGFALGWVEDDGIFGKDRGVAADLRLPVYRFLGQEYTILPQSPGSFPPAWLRQLAESDAGDIELVSFSLTATDTGRPGFSAQGIWYNPLGDRFILVFPRMETRQDSTADCISRWIHDRREAYHRAYRHVALANREADQDPQSKELLRFGSFLKRLGTRHP